MASYFGPSANEPIVMAMTDVLGPAAVTITLFSPTRILGPSEIEQSYYIPNRVLGQNADEQVSVGPSGHFGAPTGGTAGAAMAAARNFGGSTQGSLPVVAPANDFGGITGGKTLLSPVMVFSAATGNRTSAVPPLRGFSGCTSGITEGLPTPIGLTATAIDAGCILLEWIDPGPEEDGYRIQRSLADASDWTVIGSVGENVTEFLDRFAIPLVVYDYRVVGFDSVRESLPSNIATAVTPLPPDLPVSTPSGSSSNQQRNRIEPDAIDFKSPGTYGLEKDSDGSVTGFKF